MQPKNFLRPDWSPLPEHPDWFGVEGRVLLLDERIVVATLRFSENAQTEVLCLDGEGYSYCGAETVRIRGGQSVLWPRGEPHNLFTRGSTMTTLMLERVQGQRSAGNAPTAEDDR